jgi:ubiquinone/menaquinone biosynthesis C-methylase UbiE
VKDFNRKNHWDNIYNTKELKYLSWYQPLPATSLNFLKQFSIPTTGKIIDIGGGDCLLVDYLLDSGYQDITVLDISELALDRAKKRLGNRALKVKWIVTDVTTFKPTEKYDFWHDRATFHFLTMEQEIEAYLNTARQSIKSSGVLVIGTFSEEGPKSCSGLETKQYSEAKMADTLKKYFEKIKCITINHRTPFDTIQNFTFCSFKKLQGP